jgi:hypothetical protein
VVIVVTGEENRILELATAVGVGKETGFLARILTSENMKNYYELCF